MIKRIAITTLVMTALCTSVLGCISCYFDQLAVLRLTRRHWVLFQVGDGSLRIFWVESQAPRVELLPAPNQRSVGVFINEWGPPTPPRRALRNAPYRIGVGRRERAPSFGVQWRTVVMPWTGTTSVVRSSMVRTPVWLPTALLLVYPAVAFVKGPLRIRHRQRRNECLQCGYSLEGLPQPRCPECGREITIPNLET